MALKMLGGPLLNPVKRWAKTIVADQQTSKYLENSKLPRLNLGCGINVVDGWLNVDQITGPPGVVFLNGSSHWPYKDHSFEVVLCEHMIEHVNKEIGEIILAEIFRILRPGGSVRLVTPDLNFLGRVLNEQSPQIDLYLDRMREFLGVELSRCDAVNAAFRNYGHSYIYTPAELRRQMEGAGFVNIVETRGGQPDNPIFIGAEGHGAVIGDDVNALEAFGLEARKPDA